MTSNGTGSPYPQQSGLPVAFFYFKLARRHGNKRLFRKVIQILEVGAPQALELARSYLELATLLGKDPDCTYERDECLGHCQRIMESLPIQAYLEEPTVVDDSFDPLEVGRFCCDSGEAYFRVWNLDNALCCLKSAIHLFNKAILHTKDPNRAQERDECLQRCRRAMDSLPVKAYLADPTTVDDSFDALEAGGLYRDLGDASLQAGNLDGARYYLETSIGVLKMCRRANMMMNIGNEECADDLSRSYGSLAQVFFQQDHFYEAATQFKFAVASARHKTSKLLTVFHELLTNFDHGDYCQKVERCSRFIRSVTMTLRLDSKGPLEVGRIHCILSMANQRLGNLNDAHAYAEEAIQIFDEHTPESQDSWQSHHVLAQIKLKCNAFEDAIEHFQRAAEIAESVKSMSALATTYREMGSAFRDNHDYDQAISFTQRAIKIQERYCSSRSRELTQ